MGLRVCSLGHLACTVEWDFRTHRIKGIYVLALRHKLRNLKWEFKALEYRAVDSWEQLGHGLAYLPDYFGPHAPVR